MGFEPDITDSFCFFEPTFPAARRALLRDVEDARREGYAVVQTDWRPDGSADPADEPFSRQPLRDFRIPVPASPYDIQVLCV